MDAVSSKAASVASFLRDDYLILDQECTVDEVIIKLRGFSFRNVPTYLYVSRQGRLVGVVSMRRILFSDGSCRLSELAKTDGLHVLTERSTEVEARQIMKSHHLLCLPMVDGNGTMKGCVDTAGLIGMDNRVDGANYVVQLFESLTNSFLNESDAPFMIRVFRRGRLLFFTILVGVSCAVVAVACAESLRSYVVLSLFLPLVLGLGEAMCSQSMAIHFQRRGRGRTSGGWGQLAEQGPQVVVISIVSGILVTLLSAIWIIVLPSSAPLHSDAGLSSQTMGGLLPAISLGLSTMFSMVMGAVFGTLVTQWFSRSVSNGVVASGPVALGLSDVATTLMFTVFVVGLL